MLDTYCDNELLRDYILDALPSKSGLYPHELIMIFYAQIGQILYDSPGFSSIFSQKLEVHYPLLLLDSLVKRDYLRRSDFDEKVLFLKTKDIREFLRSKNLKIPNRRETLIDTLLNNFSEEEIENRFPQSYWVPTRKGIRALNQVGNYLLNEYLYAGWERNSGYANPMNLTKTDISILEVKITGMDIEISENNYKYFLLINGKRKIIYGRVVNLNSEFDLVIRKCGKFVCELESIDRIYILENIKIVLFYSISCFSSVTSAILDVDKGKILKIETEPKNIMFTTKISYSEFLDTKLKKQVFSIYHKGIIIYYVSAHHQIPLLILSEIFQKKLGCISLEDIPSPFQDDFTKNIKVYISKNDELSKNMIQFFILKGWFSAPQIFDVPVYEIAKHIFIKSSISRCRTESEKYIIKDELTWHPASIDVINYIERKYGNTDLLESYIWNFPKAILENPGIDLYSRYVLFTPICTSYTRRDSNWEYARNHEIELQAKYNSYLIEMYRENLISPRWKSEVELFFAIREYFPDAIYQYHASWLGQQSIDIYIPTKNIAIEYQGKQHYEPVNFFGGIDNFRDTQKRDERKVKLCKENNVKLLLWHYSIPVTNENVFKFLLSQKLISGIAEK